MTVSRETGRTVVFAPDSFKGTVAAVEAARLLADGWADVDPSARLILRPMADGGEGTLDAFAAATAGARRLPVGVAGPGGGARVEAEWLLLPPTPDAPNGTGVVELASTAGIGLMPVLDAWGADTRGFGQAIAAALDHGVSRLVLAIGSSCSSDGGWAVLSALGARFGGIRDLRGAHALTAIDRVDLSGLRPLPSHGVIVLTDVANPLTGPRGAAAVFGPQKGLAAEDVPLVDAALARYASFFDVDPALPGAGAAGGTGFALAAWGARLVPGAAQVAALIDLPAELAGADAVITGEGTYDGQSAGGKVPAYVAGLAAAAGTASLLVCGRSDGGDLGPFAQVVSLTEMAGSGEAAMSDARRWLRAAGAEMARRL